MPLSSSTTPSATNNLDYTTTNIPAFLSKLWTLVEDPKYDELIAWDSSGFSFHVFDQTRFSREILPRFFKHNNMASFIRQLNMYGFRKVNSIDHGSLKIEKQDMEFHHPYFIKGKEQFLEFIKRKVSDVKPPSQNQNSNEVATSQQNSNQQALSLQYPPMMKSVELNKMLDDVNSIKSKQKIVDDSLFSVKKENEALWKEISSLRQKHHHQQQIVNKLIHFLVHLVNPSSLGIKRTNRPLMIDSHSTASLVNIEDDDQINEVESTDIDEDQEFINFNKSDLASSVNSELSNNDFNLSNQRKIQQLVELEDEDEKTIIQGQKRKSNNYITEIETINKNKKINNNNNSDINDAIESNNAVDISYSQPLSKKLKKFDTGDLNSLPDTVENNKNENNLQQFNYLYTNDTFDLKNGETNQQAKTISTTDDEFLDPNLFLNTTSSNESNGTISNNILCAQNLTANSPIVSLPISPLANANNAVQTLSSNNQYINQTSGSNSNDFNSLKRTISSLKNSSSNVTDHIESLQIDLNSIKEYLTNSSFSNQLDTYTINNLFSPIVLDQIDGEPFYLEQPLSTSNVTEINTPVNQPNTNSNSSGNNGKIVGNEIIQFQPSDIFDELFNNDLKEKSKSIIISDKITQQEPGIGDTKVNSNNLNDQDYNSTVFSNNNNQLNANANSFQNVSTETSNGVIIEKS